MINAQADLRLTLHASVYFEQCKAAIEKATTSRKESDLRVAANLINSERFEALLPEREKITLTRLYVAAAYHCYGGLE